MTTGKGESCLCEILGMIATAVTLSIDLLLRHWAPTEVHSFFPPYAPETPAKAFLHFVLFSFPSFFLFLLSVCLSVGLTFLFLVFLVFILAFFYWMYMVITRDWKSEYVIGAYTFAEFQMCSMKLFQHSCIHITDFSVRFE